jgi:hypothetical protein
MEPECSLPCLQEPATDPYPKPDESNLNFPKIQSNIGAGIAQWYSAGLRAGWSGFRVPAGAGNFSLHHRVQTGSGAHSASYLMGTRSFFPGGKSAGAWSRPLTSI